MPDSLERTLRRVAAGELKPEVAARQIGERYRELGFAKVDLQRPTRTGFPEAIYCPGKSPEQVAHIAAALVENGQTVLATKAGNETFEAVKRTLPQARYIESAQMVVIEAGELPKLQGSVSVLTGGTSDIPIAEEAAATAEAYGASVERLWDVGVAGVHRLLANSEVLERATVVIAVAGMEGALPSVVAGLVGKPIVAVPTSVGYGASFQGLAPLLAMLNSCAPGVCVVNIDNGFGAGYLAALICKALTP